MKGSSATFGQGRYNATGSISATGLAEVYQPNLMGRAITSTARLIELFWREAGAEPSEPHPADTNRDWMLSNTGFSAYGAAWRNGQAWPTGPSPIPLDYVTRAGHLAANGPEYRQVSGEALPRVWEPGVRGITR